MTKTLEQIQKENRKFILEAIHCCSYDEALKIEGQEIKPLTLSRVLLVFSRNIFKNKISLQFPDFLHVNGFNWYFIKETLEEQSEETQRKTNELFTN